MQRVTYKMSGRRRWMRLATPLALLLALGGLTDAAADTFWDHWGDGRAELSGYRLIQPRYGEARAGRAVMIFVTEPFSLSRRVKVDRYDPQSPDHRNILKLNLVRKFQTGIYDYSVMTSVFADPGRGFSPLKITFSSQEWCGHTFQDTRFSEGGASISINSYFEGETGQKEMPLEGALAEDALWITLRQLAAPKIAAQPQPSGQVKLLSSAFQDRMAHQPSRIMGAEIVWDLSPREVKVPAGRFQVVQAKWSRPSRSCVVDLERAYPHRIVQWRCEDGEHGAMTGSARLPYWQLHGASGVGALEALGLPALGFDPAP